MVPGDRVRIRPGYGYTLHDPIAFRRAGPDGVDVTIRKPTAGRRVWFQTADGRHGDTGAACIEQMEG